MNSGPAVL